VTARHVDRSRRVLVVVSSTQRRGAQLEAVAVAEGLRRYGVETDLTALERAPEGLDLPVLGPAARHPETLRALRRLARRHDLVVAFGSTTLPACAAGLAGSRVPWLYRSIGDPGAWVRGRLHRERTGLLMRRAHQVVALWPAAGRQISSLYRVPPKRIVSIPNGRDPARFTPASPDQRRVARERLGVPADVPVAVVIGALDADKRVEDAITACGKVPDLHLVVAGDGPQRPAADLTPRVRFLGAVPDPAAVLAAADLGLLTSRTEGMPAAVIEALFCGLPVVATDVGAVADIVEVGTTGLLVPVGDVGAIAAAIETVLTWPREQVGARRADLVARYGIDAVVARWADLLTG